MPAPRINTPEQLLDLIHTGDSKTIQSAVLGDGILGERVRTLRDRAKLMTLPDAGHVDADRQALNKIEEKIRELESSKVPSDALKKTLENQKRTLEQKVSGHYKAAGALAESHTQAAEALEKARESVKKSLAEEAGKKVKSLSTGITSADSVDPVLNHIDNIRTNHSDLEKRVNTFFDEAIQNHKNEAAAAGDFVKTLESSSGISQKGAGAGKFAGKISFSRMGEVWKGSSTPMKVVRSAGGLVGLGAVIIGLRDIGRGVGIIAPARDEDGKPVEGGALKGLAELIVGGGVGYLSLLHGGKGTAISR